MQPGAAQLAQGGRTAGHRWEAGFTEDLAGHPTARTLSATRQAAGSQRRTVNKEGQGRTDLLTFFKATRASVAWGHLPRHEDLLAWRELPPRSAWMAFNTLEAASNTGWKKGPGAEFREPRSVLRNRSCPEGMSDGKVSLRLQILLPQTINRDILSYHIHGQRSRRGALLGERGRRHARRHADPACCPKSVIFNLFHPTTHTN